MQLKRNLNHLRVVIKKNAVFSLKTPTKELDAGADDEPAAEGDSKIKAQGRWIAAMQLMSNDH